MPACAAIQKADSNSYAYNTILLAASSYVLTDATAGELVINNSSSLAEKTLTIAGQGTGSSIIGFDVQLAGPNFRDHGFERQGRERRFSGTLAIEGGDAQNGGAVGGNAALGGGLLIEDAAVTLSDVVVQNNLAQGNHGSTGAAGHTGAAGGAGGDGRNAQGGGIYLASGTLFLVGDTISLTTPVEARAAKVEGEGVKDPRVLPE